MEAIKQLDSLLDKYKLELADSFTFLLNNLSTLSKPQDLVENTLDSSTQDTNSICSGLYQENTEPTPVNIVENVKDQSKERPLKKRRINNQMPVEGERNSTNSPPKIVETPPKESVEPRAVAEKTVITPVVDEPQQKTEIVSDLANKEVEDSKLEKEAIVVENVEKKNTVTNTALPKSLNSLKTLSFKPISSPSKAINSPNRHLRIPNLESSLPDLDFEVVKEGKRGPELPLEKAPEKKLKPESASQIPLIDRLSKEVPLASERVESVRATGESSVKKLLELSKHAKNMKSSQLLRTIKPIATSEEKGKLNNVVVEEEKSIPAPVAKKPEVEEKVEKPQPVEKKEPVKPVEIPNIIKTQTTFLVRKPEPEVAKPKIEIKALQSAAHLIKKEQMEKERKAKLKEAAEKRQQMILKKRQEDAKLEEEKKRKFYESAKKPNIPESNTLKPPQKVAIDHIKTPPSHVAVAPSKPPTKEFEFAKPSPIIVKSNPVKQAKPVTSIKNPILDKLFSVPDLPKPHAKTHTTIMDENGEIPDIDSDESSSEETNKPPLPEWALPHRIEKTLEKQLLIDPEVIFGKIPDCDLEEIFKGSLNAKKLKKRTSSANWAGVDELTEYEELRYKQKMGYIQ